LIVLPNVVTLNLGAANSALLYNASTATTSFTLLTTVLDAQRRIVVSSSGDESSNTFTIIGTNQAGFSISQTIAGINIGSSFTDLDFKTVTSIRALNAAAATVKIGTNSTGSCLWQIMNWHVTPTNIEASGVVTSTSTAVTWRVEYTYDDPNNLPSGQAYPQPFIHPTLNGTTSSLDGPINDPVTGVRFTITGGTGVVRGTIIQAGIAGP
jgi:hypothetical protein